MPHRTCGAWRSRASLLYRRPKFPSSHICINLDFLLNCISAKMLFFREKKDLCTGKWKKVIFIYYFFIPHMIYLPTTQKSVLGHPPPPKKRLFKAKKGISTPKFGFLIEFYNFLIPHMIYLPNTLKALCFWGIFFFNKRAFSEG